VSAGPIRAREVPPEGVSLKSVALPVEHGGWGMLGEPLLLGLLVAPSWAGLGVGVAALGAFLARHPLKLALADRLRKARYPRTAAAERFILMYGAVTLAGVGLAATRGAAGWWAPLALAAPLALVQLAYDARHQGRALVPELLGGVALASVAAAEMRAAGLAVAAAVAAWVLVAAKAVVTVLYVRARLRYDRGLAPDRTSAVVAHVAVLLLGAFLAAAGRAPWLAAGAFALLLARALYGLSPLHRRVRPQAVGVQEMAFGFCFVLIVALGYALGL
jgi:YwiC-like protein